MERRLTKGSSPVIGGVFSGFADYLGVDPVLLRLAGVLALLLNGGVGFIYLICWVILPPYDGKPAAQGMAVDTRKIGILLMGAGVILLIKNFFPQFTMQMLLAVVLIGLGLLMLVRK